MRVKFLTCLALALATSCTASNEQGAEFILEIEGELFHGYSQLDIKQLDVGGSKTELNVLGYTEARNFEITLRLYNNRVDLQPVVREGRVLEDVIYDPRDRSGYDGPPPNYVLINDPKTFWSTHGEYSLDFSEPRRVSGRFSAHLTGVSVEAPRDVEASFSGPLEISCWVPNGDGTNTLVRDPKFETDFCAPFKKHDGS